MHADSVDMDRKVTVLKIVTTKQKAFQHNLRVGRHKNEIYWSNLQSYNSNREKDNKKKRPKSNSYAGLWKGKEKERKEKVKTFFSEFSLRQREGSQQERPLH